MARITFSSFWTTFAGLLTGAAALISAVVGLMMFLDGGSSAPAARAAGGGTVATRVETTTSSTTATSVPDGADLVDRLVDACSRRDFTACDELWATAEAGSDAERFGGFCGGNNAYDARGNCALISLTTDACALGDPYACGTLAALACEVGGDLAACSLLP